MQPELSCQLVTETEAARANVYAATQESAATVPGNRSPTECYGAEALPELPASFQLGLGHVLPLVSKGGHSAKRHIWTSVEYRIVETEIGIAAHAKRPAVPRRYIDN